MTRCVWVMLHHSADLMSLQDAKAVEFIEEALKSDGHQMTDLSTAPGKAPQPIGSAARRPPSLKGLSRPSVDHTRQMLPRRLSQTSTGAPTSAQTATSQPDSWRSRTVNPPVSTTVRSETTPQPTSVFPEQPSTFQQDHVLIFGVEEDLEVVDFSDLARFVGDHDASDAPVQNLPEIATAPHSRPARPVASDFFHDPPGTFTQTDMGSWRRKDLDRDPPGPFTEDASQSAEVLSMAGSADAEPSPAFQPKEVTAPDHHAAASRHGAGSNYVQQRTPRSAVFHREADLSAWDDAMSRIKGALDGMQASDPLMTAAPQPLSSTKPAPPKEPRWIPPPLRVRHANLDVQTCEEFFSTVDRSQASCTVRLPSTSRFLELLSRKQLHLLKLPVHWRWDILSWDPPVDGMNRRDLSLNEVLFRKLMHKGKPRYRVQIPRSRLRTGKGPGAIGPRVHLPANTATIPKPNAAGYQSRVSEADGASNWRKPVSPAIPKIEVTDEIATNAVLDTVSRSPPPELSQDRVDAAYLPKPGVSLVKSETILIRARSQPKMPAGSAVAFYRDSRIDTVDSDQDTSVTFIVSSELEEASPLPSQVAPVEKSTFALSPSATTLPNGTESSKDPKVENPLNSIVNGLKSQPPSPEYDVPSLVQSHPDSKSSDSVSHHSQLVPAYHPVTKYLCDIQKDRLPMTPPTQHTSTTWAAFSLKESPARAPDPEHLKAVWSQPSDKAKLPAINSLEGIVDDLTALPFTLQDVKFEDGETPPPSVVPTRMTMHDVTRAFQQVPPSSSSSSIHRVTSISPPTMHPPQRQFGYSYALPPPTNAEMRTNFSPYSSPMLSHSPTPAMIFPPPMQSHVPRIPMNGHTPVYNQPMWVTLTGPTSQNNGGMIRPMGSPYQAQMIPYPSPNTPAVYGPPPNMPNSISTAPSQTNATRGRMPLMSPAMPHVAPHSNVPMYAGSPVLVHAPMQMAPGHPYMPGPPGRRTDPPGHPPLPQTTSSHNTGYTYVRPSW